MVEPVKIFLVEDHDLFREGIKYVLNSFSDFKIIGEAINGIDFLNALKNECPDIVLMDIDMPLMNGIEATKKAIELFPNLKVLTLSMHGDQEYYRQMIAAGSKGFILKNSSIDELRNAITEILNENVYFSQELLMSIILKNNTVNNINTIQHYDISERELDVLKLICKGYSNNQIADELFISVKTVEGHKSKLMTKTDTNKTVSLVLFAIKNELVEV